MASREVECRAPWTRRTRQSLSVAAGAVAVVLLFGACSGDDDKGASTTSSSAARPTTTTLPVVKAPTVAEKAIPVATWSAAFCQAIRPLGQFRLLTDTSTEGGNKVARELRAQVQPVSKAVLALAPMGYPDLQGGRELAQETIDNYAQGPTLMNTVKANPGQLSNMSGELLRASVYRVIIALFQSKELSSKATVAATELAKVQPTLPECQGLQ